MLFSESRMDEESKGEPSKVESVNIDQNQSPKKVSVTEIILSIGFLIYVIKGANVINLHIQL